MKPSAPLACLSRPFTCTSLGTRLGVWTCGRWTPAEPFWSCSSGWSETSNGIPPVERLDVGRKRKESRRRSQGSVESRPQRIALSTSRGSLHRRPPRAVVPSSSSSGILRRIASHCSSVRSIDHGTNTSPRRWKAPWPDWYARLGERFQARPLASNPEEWAHYHTMYRQLRESAARGERPRAPSQTTRSGAERLPNLPQPSTCRLEPAWGRSKAGGVWPPFTPGRGREREHSGPQFP
jgi:hypothetical protein